MIFHACVLISIYDSSTFFWLNKSFYLRIRIKTTKAVIRIGEMELAP